MKNPQEVSVPMVLWHVTRTEMTRLKMLAKRVMIICGILTIIGLSYPLFSVRFSSETFRFILHLVEINGLVGLGFSYSIYNLAKYLLINKPVFVIQK